MMEIKFLGSSSPRCYKDRNCISNLIKSGENNIILDFGNGSSRLLEPEDLNNLTIIISHLHKDHYGELLSIGYDSYINHNIGLLNNRIKVYLPADYLSTSPDYNYLMNYGEEKYMEFYGYSSMTKLEIGNIYVTFSRNPHQIDTYSTKLESMDGTLVYSGDTGYIGNSLESFAKNSDILICESTFLKGQTRIGNNHLYAYEAAKIAKKANVKKLVLTHFYPTIDKQKYLEEAKEVFENVDVAEEGKTLTLKRRV